MEKFIETMRKKIKEVKTREENEKVFEFEEPEDFESELEEILLEIKELFDIPTDEINKTLDSVKKN